MVRVPVGVLGEVQALIAVHRGKGPPGIKADCGGVEGHARMAIAGAGADLSGAKPNNPAAGVEPGPQSFPMNQTVTLPGKTPVQAPLSPPAVSAASVSARFDVTNEQQRLARLARAREVMAASGIKQRVISTNEFGDEDPEETGSQEDTW